MTEFVYTTSGASINDAKRQAKENKLPVVISSCELIDEFATMKRFRFKKKED